MPDSPTSEPEADFVCGCDEWARSACAGEPFYKEHEGKRYCVLHFPGKGKSADFEKAFQQKLDNKDFNFRYVWFPDCISFPKFDFSAVADFSFATFGAEANFNGATFGAAADFSFALFSAAADFSFATFSAKADFTFTTFSAEADFVFATFTAAADFRSATLSAEANFLDCTFGAATYFSFAAFSAKANFHSATFGAAAHFYSAILRADASFFSATFGAAADFRFATFSAEVNFYDATFADHLSFSGNNARPVFTDTLQLDIQFGRVEKPDQVSFHTAILRPHWFVNVDARKFDFTNVDWDWRTVNEETDSLNANKVSSPHSMLFIACRRLADNAEENHRYEEASKFRYMAMEARRRETWRGFAIWRLSWWYWLASDYGERALRAFLVLLGIWFLAGLLYGRVGFARWEPKLATEADIVAAKRDEVGAPLKFSRALTYSVGVMTLQKPEPRPATTAAQTVVLLETILGPVQAALLALAIRRKFMR